MAETRRDRLVRELRQLKELLGDREAALPAHSVRPHQIQEIEELEEKIAAVEKELKEIPNRSFPKKGCSKVVDSGDQ